MRKQSNNKELMGLRAVSLLRVSTKVQATKTKNSAELDIPAQKAIVDDYIQKEGLVSVQQFIETVSGFSVAFEARDAVIEIKRMAEAREFDVLVVYMSDRIGRQAIESPLVIRFLNSQGVRVISVVEGELSMDGGTNSLLTFLKFWLNEEFSITLRQRVTDYQIESVKTGKFRGGGVGGGLPYGYRLVNNGRVNHKGRNVFDDEINPDEAEVVRLIYDLSITHNMGSRRIAEELNKRQVHGRAGVWVYSTVNQILNNPIYKGVRHMKAELYGETIYSPVQEHLIIITEEMWAKNQLSIAARKNGHTGELTETLSLRGIGRGRLLLSGLVYCGHCGSAMSVSANHKKWATKSGEERKAIRDFYRCRADLNGLRCDGKRTYIAHRIEDLVERETKSFILDLSGKTLSEGFKRQLAENVTRAEKTVKMRQDELVTLQKELASLKDEIAKSILGTSRFSPELLNEAINREQEAIEEGVKRLQMAEQELMAAKLANNEYSSLESDLSMWETMYDNATIEHKKAMLGSIVDRVTIYRDSVTIKFKISLMTFAQNSEDLENLDDHNSLGVLGSDTQTEQRNITSGEHPQRVKVSIEKSASLSHST